MAKRTASRLLTKILSKMRQPGVYYAYSFPARSMAGIAVAESVRIVSRLLVDVRRRPVGRGLVDHRGLRIGRFLVRLQRFRDGVAPVWRGHSFVRVNDAESGREAADHAARSVWSACLFVDALDEDVVRRGCLDELQDDLVRPVARVLSQDLVAVGALPVSHDRDARIELLPELERDGRDLDVADLVPRDERVVKLLRRVVGGEELRLWDQG